MSIYKYVWCDSLSNRCGVRVSHETCVKFVTRCLIHMSHTHIAVSFICLTHICVESVTRCLIYMCVRGCDVLITHTPHTHNQIILCMTYILLSYSSTHIRLVAHPSEIMCVMRACAGYDMCGECVWWKSWPIRLTHHTHVQLITHTFMMSLITQTLITHMVPITHTHRTHTFRHVTHTSDKTSRHMCTRMPFSENKSRTPHTCLTTGHVTHTVAPVCRPQERWRGGSHTSENESRTPHTHLTTGRVTHIVAPACLSPARKT